MSALLAVLISTFVAYVAIIIVALLALRFASPGERQDARRPEQLLDREDAPGRREDLGDRRDGPLGRGAYRTGGTPRKKLAPTPTHQQPPEGGLR